MIKNINYRKIVNKIQKMKFKLYVIIGGIIVGGCSNAPPNIFRLPAYGNPDQGGFSIDSRLLMRSENKTYRTYKDPILWERSDGKMVSPEYSNFIDMFTVSGFRRFNDILLGAYMSNLYPGIFVGYCFKYFTIGGFGSSSIPGNKYFPGIQIFSEYNLLYFSYSFYQENLGSFVTNPGFGEEGPYKKVVAERYNIGIKPNWNQMVKLGIGMYLDRTYWKNVYSSGIEFNISI